ncbi:hypothetical protein [Derxia gummosa]|uniref:Uncharacterized protein n=1 Tax=Derxia gummosa DSM 723 TaxID=1121388 RepID=A0A8B6X5Y2_9BURK|nr:hypothetical protein [Derxia gummosa]
MRRRPRGQARAAVLALLSLGMLGVSALAVPGADGARAELFMLGTARLLQHPAPGALAALLLLPAPLRLRLGGNPLGWRQGRLATVIGPALGWLEGLALLGGLLLPERCLPPLAGGWAGQAGMRTAVGRAARVIAALVTGLALGLLFAALGLVRADTGPALLTSRVAAGLLLCGAALHAWRPLLAGREALLAGVGGLTHGLMIASGLGAPFMPGAASAGVTAFALGGGALLAGLLLPFTALLALLARAEAGYAVLRVLGALGLAVAGWPG